MFRSRYLALLLLLPLVLCQSSLARADNFPLAEYEEHVKRYLSSLENLAVDITMTDYTLDGRTVIRDEISLISIPGHFRAKAITRATEKGGGERVKTEWSLLRPDGYYVITEKEGVKFVLKGMQKGLNSPLFAEPYTPLNILTQPICDVRYPLLRILR